jgi:hypothetical protein
MWSFLANQIRYRTTAISLSIKSVPEWNQSETQNSGGNQIACHQCTVYEKIRCRCPCACHPLEFQATPMQLVGLGRVGLQAIWDEKSQSPDKNF